MELSTIIVSWNTRELLLECLGSVRAHARRDPLEHEILVVDNASEDGSADAVAREFPEVILLRNRENLGFGRAVNQALDVVHGDFVFLLNSDTRLVSDAPGELIAFLRANPSVGIAGPRLITPEGHPQISFGDFPSPWLFLTTHLGLLRKIVPTTWVPRLNCTVDEGERNPIPVDYVSGAALMIRRAFLNTVGRFDPGYRLYYEETDLCFRFRMAGLQVCLFPATTVIHHLGKSLLTRRDRDRDEAQLISMESEIRFFAKFHGRVWAWLFRLYYIVHNGRHYLSRTLKGDQARAARSRRFFLHARSIRIPAPGTESGRPGGGPRKGTER
jgi:GT2 family glycosyltransferase